MGKLRKLRTRLISSIGAVKRSVLRRQSQLTSSSTVSNPTALTRLASLDSAVPAGTGGRRGSKAQKRKLQVRLQTEAEEGAGEQQIQLHWNEARRIYSEPVQVTQSLSRREENSTGITVVDLHSESCTAHQEHLEHLDNTVGSLTSSRSVQDVSQLSDEEDYDDVFLQSWEETGYRCTEEDFLMGAKSSLSEISSGYSTSTISNDNLNSPALYLPPPSGDGAYSELEQREGGVSGWDDWRIAESEVTLGTVITSTDRETIYSGYWHGNVQVRSRKVREVEDLICFLDEVTTLSCIRHENVQLFMGACLSMQERSLAIVMSEIKGDTLHTRLHNCGHAFTNSSKVRILRQIAEGMEYLHGRGIPHGLLSSQSISLHCRICISLAPQYSRSNARQLEPHKIPYLPPECVRELRASQCRSRSHSVNKCRSCDTSRDYGVGSCGCGASQCMSCDTSCDHNVWSCDCGVSRCRSCDTSCAHGGSLCDRGDCGRRRVHSCEEDHGGWGLWAPSERRMCKIQLKGRPTLSADIFAFGTIVYELMLLEYPYKALPLETQIWRIGKGDLQALTLVPKGRLHSIISRCWVESPQRRPSFKELLASIEQDIDTAQAPSFGPPDKTPDSHSRPPDIREITL